MSLHNHFRCYIPLKPNTFLLYPVIEKEFLGAYPIKLLLIFWDTKKQWKFVENTFHCTLDNCCLCKNVDSTLRHIGTAWLGTSRMTYIKRKIILPEQGMIIFSSTLAWVSKKTLNYIYTKCFIFIQFELSIRIICVPAISPRLDFVRVKSDEQQLL